MVQMNPVFVSLTFLDFFCETTYTVFIIIFRKKVFFTNPTENTLLHGPVRPALLRYALPIILSMVATQFYSVADTMIIGLRLDADALAAVSNASTILMLFLFISGGMELGGGLLVAAGRPTATRQEMAELLYNLLFVDLVLALGLTALGFFTLPPCSGSSGRRRRSWPRRCSMGGCIWSACPF